MATTARTLQLLNLKTTYRTGESDAVAEFFAPCLMASTGYDRAVGYFRSTVYHLIGREVVDFVRRGGKMRLICSPQLTIDDIELIGKAYEVQLEGVEQSILRDIDEVLADDDTEYSARVLGALVASGGLEIRLAFRSDGMGIYHEKIGVFFDDASNHVSFIGSANETWSGWHSHGNYESIEVFSTWRGYSEKSRVDEHRSYYERLWTNQIPNLNTISFPEVAKEVLVRNSVPIESVEFSAAKAEKRSKKREPFEHQIKALENWKLNRWVGIFEHATGSGKTFTAIIAVKEHVALGLPILVLVPSVILLYQWNTEICAELPEALPLLVGGGNNGWKRDRILSHYTNALAVIQPRIVIATMQTACTPAFRDQLVAGEHLLVVVDEVHQIGSVNNSEALNIQAGKRLGLSATPSRYGDPEGTARIFAYFQKVIEPRYTLFDAIRDKRLVPYEYYPHPIRLSDDEKEAYSKISDKIRKQIAQDSSGSSSIVISDQTKMLLIRRARIAKKASAKLELASEVLLNHRKTHQQWLVYCEDIDQLNTLDNLLKTIGISSIVYHSTMEGIPHETLAYFKVFGGVLLSVRCLDEGIDIPSISHALILASSQNPRQFIQRRGRVLRRADTKSFAVIHDTLVLPDDFEREQDQLALTKSELARAIEFSGSALNKSPNFELRRLAIDCGIDPSTLYDQGLEEE